MTFPRGLFGTLLLFALPAQLHGAPPSPATPQTHRVAVVNTEAFGVPQTGVLRLVAALEQVEREFRPRSEELEQLRNRYRQLSKEVDAARSSGNQKELQAKSSQAASLRSDIEHRAQDGQRALETRLKEVTDPINADIFKSLRAWARQRGFDVVFDISKTTGAMMVTNDDVNITSAFIAEYNAGHALK